MAKNILIVEDDKFLSDIYQSQFQKEGFETRVAVEGAAALVMVKEKKPDLITLDLIMPGMNGFDFLDALRKEESGKDIQVMILTNLAQAEDRKRCESTGLCEYLVKTEVEIDEVVRRVKEKLGGYENS